MSGVGWEAGGLSGDSLSVVGDPSSSAPPCLSVFSPRSESWSCRPRRGCPHGLPVLAQGAPVHGPPQPPQGPKASPLSGNPVPGPKLGLSSPRRGPWPGSRVWRKSKKGFCPPSLWGLLVLECVLVMVSLVNRLGLGACYRHLDTEEDARRLIYNRFLARVRQALWCAQWLPSRRWRMTRP